MKNVAEYCNEKGIDMAKAIASFKRSRSRAINQDRPKFFADTKAGDVRRFSWAVGGPKEVNRLMGILRDTDMTSTYVTAWCRLNHLKG